MNKIYALIFCLIISNNISFGQIGTSSPYSRYGIGDFQFIASSQYNALSGAITAFSDPTYINPHNPSTYIDYGPNSFLFTTGLRHRIIKMQNDNNINGCSRFLVPRLFSRCNKKQYWQSRLYW